MTDPVIQHTETSGGFESGDGVTPTNAVTVREHLQAPSVLASGEYDSKLREIQASQVVDADYCPIPLIEPVIFSRLRSYTKQMTSLSPSFHDSSDGTNHENS